MLTTIIKMKFSNLFTFLLLGCTACAQAASECITADEYDATKDYFPSKVAVTASKFWSIEYFNSYKVLTNIAQNETYLLYQCGTPIPQNIIDNGSFTTVVEIPVKAVGLEETVLIPFVEQLGLVDTIVAFTTDPLYVSSPCLLESIEGGDVAVLKTREELSNFTAPQDTAIDIDGALGFISDFNSAPTFTKTAKIGESSEKSNAAIFEWIKFISAFFNAEAKADEVFQATEERWECVSSNANRVQTDNPDKPVVLWAYYSDYCEGWDIGECPNYYCEYANECSATILNSTDGFYSDTCFSTYMTTEQLVEFGKDADHWIYPSANWDETYALFKDQLDTMTSVTNMEVFDYQGAGSNAWFEQRFGEYFAVLQDFCSIVGTTQSFADKSWFRNVMDGTEVGTLGTCTEGSRASSIVPVVGAVCEELAPDTQPESASHVSSFSTIAQFLFALAVTAAFA